MWLNDVFVFSGQVHGQGNEDKTKWTHFYIWCDTSDCQLFKDIAKFSIPDSETNYLEHHKVSKINENIWKEKFGLYIIEVIIPEKIVWFLRWKSEERVGYLYFNEFPHSLLNGLLNYNGYDKVNAD